MTIDEDAVRSNSTAVNISKPPDHVAIIMDGNGRWAQKKGLPRVEGHRKGLETLREIVKHAVQREIKFLTLYSFSSENWRRPSDEISFLLGLLKRFVNNDLAELHSANIRIRVIGERTSLSDDILTLLHKAENLTKGNSGMVLVVAFNYGSRNEIIRGIRGLLIEVSKKGRQLDEINEQLFADILDTSGIPDPDVIIRTSGEKRLSNFLLWQAAYAEFVFRDEFWPDFTPTAFDEALEDFRCRERRYGGLNT